MHPKRTNQLKRMKTTENIKHHIKYCKLVYLFVLVWLLYSTCIALVFISYLYFINLILRILPNNGVLPYTLQVSVCFGKMVASEESPVCGKR